MAGIWSEIEKDDVIKAIERYKSEKGSASSKNTFLCYEGEHYPAKHIRALAFQIAFGHPIDKATFSGGKETARFFERLGFEIQYKGDNSSITISKSKEIGKKNEKTTLISQKDVTDQKNKLQLHLNKAFAGDVICEKTFEWMKTPKSHDVDTVYRNLTAALKSYRENESIGKNNYKLRCDFVCESEKIIIEYDERQHFSEARRIALLNYPKNLSLHFDKETWMENCKKVGAKDNYPPNRDEVRAYYDSVRDIEAARNGYQLIRVRHGDFDWSRQDGGIQLESIIKYKYVSQKKPLNGSRLMEYDWRSLEVELQRIRLQYLKWLYHYNPIPCDALEALKYDEKIYVVDSPYGRSFALSPAGSGSVYLGGGKGVQSLASGSYDKNEYLSEETERIKESLDGKVIMLRRKIADLLKNKEYPEVWEYIQNFWWLRLGIHEFVHDLNFGPYPVEEDDLRDYVLAAIYNKVDLSVEIPVRFSDQQILHSLRYTFSWNRFANCSYDCGPMLVSKRRFVPYKKAAEKISNYFEIHKSTLMDIKTSNGKRDFAASSLEETHEFLLLYHREPMGFLEYEEFKDKKEALREHIMIIEQRLESIGKKERLDLG